MSTPEEKFDYQRSLKDVKSYPFIQKYFPVDKYIVRPCASLIVRAVFGTAITPNQLTLISFFIAIAAAFVYLGSTHGFFALAGVLAMVSAIFDAADGALARAKALTSRYGAFLDLFLDRIADFAVLLGASVGYSRHVQDGRFLVFGLVTIALYFLQVSLYYINLLYTRSEKSGEGAQAKSFAVFLIMILSLIGRPDGILLGVFLMALTSTIVKLARFLQAGKSPAAVPAGIS
jgi:phosphatidylglycerophosphate synthase